MKPFSDLMDLILSPLKSAAVQGAENLASGIGTTVQLGLTLYIILFGWQIARGEIAEPWNEFAKRAVKLGIIVALIQSTGIYRAYVIDFLAGDLPDALSNALSSKPIPDASAFDSLANQIAILLTQLWQGTGWSAPAETARAAVVTLLVMPFLWCALIVGFTVTLWAKAGMYFVAALGPLFIALAMFEQTRKYLHNWLDQIVTMIVLQVLVALTCGLVIQGLEKAVATPPTPDSVFALAGNVIVLAVFSLAIWSSLPRLASKLGGYGANLAGAGGRVAPFEAARAPFGSFNEHGVAPLPGRPELATIAPRGGDRHTTSAPIMPPPVVTGHTEARPASSSTGFMAPSQMREADVAARSAMGPATEPDHGILGARSEGTTRVGAPFESAPAAGHAPTSAGSARAETDAIVAASATPTGTFAPSSVGLAAATASSANGLSRPPAMTPEAAFDTLLAQQRTGFEGIDFENPGPRASDGSVAAATSIPATSGPTELPIAPGSADVPPTTRPIANRRPS